MSWEGLAEGAFYNLRSEGKSTVVTRSLLKAHILLNYLNNVEEFDEEKVENAIDALIDRGEIKEKRCSLIPVIRNKIPQPKPKVPEKKGSNLDDFM